MDKMQSVLDFMAARRSSPPANLTAPFPSRPEMEGMATLALRVPDHKKLEPWRLLVIEGEKLAELALLVEAVAPNYWDDAAKCAKISGLYRDAGFVVAVIMTPKEEPLVPEWEQIASAGAVSLCLVNAALAYGYGAAWMTGFLPESREVQAFLEFEAGEKLIGLVHIGTMKNQPPERPRPDLNEKLRFL